MSGILEGVKVLDFGRYIAGPFCGALLADYGAEVIRIERVSGSEDRFVTPVTEDGQGAMFLQLNRNKLGLTLNPIKEEGKEIVKRLVERSDIVPQALPQGHIDTGCRLIQNQYRRLVHHRLADQQPSAHSAG